MPQLIDPAKLKIGDIVLIDTKVAITRIVQEKLGYGSLSHWTHVAGSLGGYDLIEGAIPRSRYANLQDYVNSGTQIQVMRPMWVDDSDRYKVAIWWAMMDNLPYDFTGLIWIGLASVVSNWLLRLKNWFRGGGKQYCSELLAHGLMKEGYNLFNKPAENVLPADFVDLKLFTPVTDIWMAA